MKIDLKNLNINKRMLFLSVALIMVATGVWFYKNKYKKKKMKIRNLKSEVERVQNEIKISEEEMPKLEEISNKYAENTSRIKALEKEEKKYEEGIPTESDIDVFLNYLTTFEKDKKLDFTSIKPIAQPEIKEKDPKKRMPYKEKEFSLKIKGSLESIIDLIYYLHEISSSSSVSDASIVLMDTGETRFLQGNLKLKALFSETNVEKRAGSFKPKIKEKYPDKIKGNCFFKTADVRESESDDSKTDDIIMIKVDGIIKMGDKSRIIHQGNIYKEGDTVQDMIIKEIKGNQVILTGSSGDIIINVEE